MHLSFGTCMVSLLKMRESQELTKNFHNDSFGRFPGLSKCPARHHPLYIFNTSICCVTHAISMHADPLLVSCSFRGAVVTAVFAAVATLRNLERVGTSCQSTASHGQRPVTPCAILVGFVDCFPWLATNNRYFLGSLVAQKSQTLIVRDSPSESMYVPMFGGVSCLIEGIIS